ncbi:MAG: rod shape-determining protein MreC [Deltaproteobacteria bacterium]|nr:rod shape-determining protein MreC [Deltaproteobacteria bacterium]MCL5791816.1 rod shape-determining protein MreC [Deltaproteobacteria bacterium]
MWNWLVSHHRHVIVIFALLIAFQVAFSDIFSKGPLVYPSKLIFDASSYVMEVANNGINNIKNLWLDYISLINVKKENTKLKEQIALLRLRLGLLESTSTEYNALLNLLNLPLPEEDISYTTAKVIGRDPDLMFRSIIVSKGGIDGIKDGDGVISPSGVVGKVIKTGSHASEVLLLTGNESYVEGIDSKTMIRGIINGIDDEHLRFMYILQDAPVNEGDLIITGGEDGTFPEGINIGTVVSVKRNEAGSMFKDIIVKPSIDINNLNYVMIITGRTHKK